MVGGTLTVGSLAAAASPGGRGLYRFWENVSQNSGDGPAGWLLLPPCSTVLAAFSKPGTPDSDACCQASLAFSRSGLSALSLRSLLEGRAAACFALSHCCWEGVSSGSSSSHPTLHMSVAFSPWSSLDVSCAHSSGDSLLSLSSALLRSAEGGGWAGGGDGSPGTGDRAVGPLFPGARSSVWGAVVPVTCDRGELPSGSPVGGAVVPATCDRGELPSGSSVHSTQLV